MRDLIVEANPKLQVPMFIDFWVPVAVAIILGLARHFLMKTMTPVFHSIIDEKITGDWRLERSEKAAENTFKTLYYVISTVMGYSYLKGSGYLPHLMFGEVGFKEQWSCYPTCDLGESFNTFYIGSMGYHLLSLVAHNAGAKRKDFIEMNVHHFATIALIVLSRLLFMNVNGMLLLWLHHWADIFTAGTRVFIDIKGPTKICLFLGIFVVWIYSRLFIFFFLGFEGLTIKPDYPDTISDQMILGIRLCFTLFVCSLYLLHIFWMAGFTRIMLTYF